MPDTSIPAQTRIGHVHLKVADLERAFGFYRDYLGFDLLFDFESAAFLSAGGEEGCALEVEEQVEPQVVAIEADSTLQVSDLEMDVSDTGLGRDGCVRHG